MMETLMPSSVATRLSRLRDQLNRQGEFGANAGRSDDDEANRAEQAFSDWQQWSQFNQQQ
jgi:hypothetical protein